MVLVDVAVAVNRLEFVIIDVSAVEHVLWKMYRKVFENCIAYDVLHVFNINTNRPTMHLLLLVEQQHFAF